MKRFPHMSISPSGSVYLDGDLIARIEFCTSTWGEEIWGYRLAGLNMNPYYVAGGKVLAARAAVVAHHRRRADRKARLSSLAGERR